MPTQASTFQKSQKSSKNMHFSTKNRIMSLNELICTHWKNYLTKTHIFLAKLKEKHIYIMLMFLCQEKFIDQIHILCKCSSVKKIYFFVGVFENKISQLREFTNNITMNQNDAKCHITITQS